MNDQMRIVLNKIEGMKLVVTNTEALRLIAIIERYINEEMENKND